VVMNEGYNYVGVMIHFGSNDFRQCTVTPEIVPPNVEPPNVVPPNIGTKL
jgi:hypothetical protein